MISGVPQGGVLGPLLFLIMMMDIDQAVMTAMVGSFADDTRLWQVINATQRTDTLQQQLQHLYDWKDGNNMHYNGDNFELMRYGRTEDKPIYHTHAETVIKQKISIRDLDVLMSSDAKFDMHIKNTAAAGH